MTGLDNKGNQTENVDAVCATLDAQGKVTFVDSTKGLAVFDSGAECAAKNMIVGNGIDTCRSRKSHPARFHAAARRS